jgi:DNA-directed RNA polymerase subunit K/omega
MEKITQKALQELFSSTHTYEQRKEDEIGTDM